MADTPNNTNGAGSRIGIPLRTLLGYGVWAVSMAVGFILTWALVYLYLETDLERYGSVYFFLTGISIGFVLVIWLDYFLDTKILPD
jgi:hypothetical protein